MYKVGDVFVSKHYIVEIRKIKLRDRVIAKVTEKATGEVSFGSYHTTFLDVWLVPFRYIEGKWE